MDDPPPPPADGDPSPRVLIINAILLDYLQQSQGPNPSADLASYLRIQMPESQPSTEPVGENLSNSSSWMGTNIKYTLIRHGCLRKYCFGGPLYSIRRSPSDDEPIEVHGDSEIGIGVNVYESFMEKLHFNYDLNSGFCGDHLPEEIKFFSWDHGPEPIGWIRPGKNVASGSKIGLNGAEDVRFTTRKMESTQKGITFSNSLGEDVAGAATSKWETTNGATSDYLEFTLILPPPGTLLSDAERALIFCIFVLWVLDTAETTWCGYFRGMVAFIFLFGIIMYIIIPT